MTAPRTSPGVDRIFYDGHCGLCHHTVLFVLRHDPAGACFRFAPLESETFRREIDEATRARLPSSVIVQSTDGRLFTRSSAVAYILRKLGGGWALLGTLLWLIPKPLRDLGYILVASVRRHLFAQPADVCPIMPPGLRVRFDL